MSLSATSHTNSPALASARQNARPEVSKATTVAQVRAALLALHSRHDHVTSELDDILADHAHLTRHLSRLDLSRARLGTLANAARSLSHGQLAPAAATATRLSDAVARLDLEQERVKATLIVVEQVSELKACVLGVVGSMGGPQDWETAAEYISRASRIPKDVVESGFAEENVPTAEVPEPPATTLSEAAKSLCNLFLREFDKAVVDGDLVRITRFFKMFPLIGRSGDGLEAYGRYVCQGVAVRARGRMQGISRQSGGVPYVTALTQLFEHIAQVVDGHTNLVQRHYGAGTMLKVMERLHVEADVQGGIVLDTWSEERSVDRKLTDVKSYAYTFLVQSFLAAPRGTGTPRSQSPMPPNRTSKLEDETEDGIDMKEIDQVLSEITSMLGHWSLYVRFVSSRAMDGVLDESKGLEPLQVPAFFDGSNLPKKIQRLLVEPFGIFSTFVLRRSIEKAFQLEEKPAGLSLKSNRMSTSNPPFITSSVDDVMYMVNQVLQRSLATSQASVVSSVLSNIGRVLSADFIGMIQRKMRDESYPKAAVQGSIPPEDKVIAFMLLSNNLDVATDYLRRIVQTHVADENGGEHANGSSSAARPLEELFPMGREANTVRTGLLNLEAAFCSKGSDLIDDSMTVLFSHVLQPRIRHLLSEVFREADYSAMDEQDKSRRQKRHDEDNDDEEQSTLTNIAQAGWQSLAAPMKKILTSRNSERLMSIAVAYLANLLEKRLWAFSGRVSEFGAIQLEQDVAAIANIAVKGENFRMRENFNKCLQIASIMNMEDEEWDEIENAATQGQDSEMSWTLNERERQRARNMIRNRE